MNEEFPREPDAISALADGRLSAPEAAAVIERLLADEQALATWHAYHVVGDVLRSQELAPATGDLSFLARLEQRMARELPAMDPVVAVNPVNPAGDSANAAVFRWKLLAGVACMALVGVVGFNLGLAPGRVDPGQIAKAPAPASSEPVLAVAEGSSGAMVRDPQLDALMAAHRQMGGHSALQTPAGFVRPATYEGARR